MKCYKIMALLLCASLLLSLLTACGGEKEPAEGSSTASAFSDKPADKSKPTGEKVSLEGDELLLAARRATAQAFDKLWYDCSPDDALIEEYYSGNEAQGADSALIQRAQALAAVTADPDRVKQEDGKVLYRTALPRNGEWVDQWVELELEAPDRPFKTVTDGFITATLENDRVFLSFTDTEEVNDYLRGWDATGDTLPVGPDHRYAVEGLFSRYKDLFMGSLYGYTYKPYLFLVTEDNGLEMVDITACFRCGFFCAMPLPGRFEERSLSAPILQDEYGQVTILVTGIGGEVCNLSWYAANAGCAVPPGGWSGAVGEVTANGETWSRMANLRFENTVSAAWGDFTITELDEETLSGDIDMMTLGMTADGIVSAFWWNTRDGVDGCAMAWCPGVESTEYETWEVLRMKQFSGVSPLCDPGETVTLYRSEFGATGATNEVVAAFAGEWLDTFSGRCWLTVTAADPTDEAHIRVEWGDSAAETYVWTMTGIPGRFDAALYYGDCTCQIVEYGENGVEIVKNTLYTDGSGCLMLSELGVLHWQDENSPQSYNCRFTPVNGESW